MLTGLGTIPVTVSPNSLSFGSVRVGGSSLAKKVTLTNQQNAALAFSSISVSAGFAITSNTCGTGIAAGANCSVSVKFIPTAPGDVSGALTFRDDGANSPQVVTLSGTGTSGR